MKKQLQIAIHAVVWSLVIGFFWIMTSKEGGPYRTLVIVGYYGLINMTVFYTNYLFLFPQYFNSKRYMIWLLSILLLIVSAVLVKYGLARFHADWILRVEKGVYRDFFHYSVGTTIVSLFMIFLSTATRSMQEWFHNEKVRSNLENEKLVAELSFLKSQINPHFLFNSLNNIYSLAYQKSPKTPEAVLKLSEIMRYMLYESNDNRVPLEKEISYLQSYIDLQKLRFKEGAFVELNLSGNSFDQPIMPLTLISFVENAFKHGVATEKDAPIIINITAEPGMVYFQTINKKADQNKDETGGVGLTNIKRRLDLLYRKKYRLEIEDGPTFYSCELFIEL